VGKAQNDFKCKRTALVFINQCSLYRNEWQSSENTSAGLLLSSGQARAPLTVHWLDLNSKFRQARNGRTQHVSDPFDYPVDPCIMVVVVVVMVMLVLESMSLRHLP
jgi:hypothetical protein